MSVPRQLCQWLQPPCLKALSVPDLVVPGRGTLIRSQHWVKETQFEHAGEFDDPYTMLTARDTVELQPHG